MHRSLCLAFLLLPATLPGNPPDPPVPAPAPEADWTHALDGARTLVVTATGYRCALVSGVLLEGGRGLSPRGGTAPGQEAEVKAFRAWAGERARLAVGPSLRRDHLLAFLEDTVWAEGETKVPARKRKAAEEPQGPAAKRQARSLPELPQVALATLMSDELPVGNPLTQEALERALRDLGAACLVLSQALVAEGQAAPWPAFTGRRPHDLAVARYQAAEQVHRLAAALEAAGRGTETVRLAAPALEPIRIADELLALLRGGSLPLEGEPAPASEVRP